MAATIMASAGSFAAVSTLLGSPLLGAFLIMEAAGIAGATLSLVALPGLLASGIGALVFVGLDDWTGLGTFSLALTAVPPAVQPTIATLLWSSRSASPAPCSAGRSAGSGSQLRPFVHRNRVPVDRRPGPARRASARRPTSWSPVGSFTRCCSPGRTPCPALVADAADYSVGVLRAARAVARRSPTASRSSAFRGGPVFPSMFIGAVLGIAVSGLPGMELAAAIGMGIGAMCCAMLRLPLTSVLLATLLLGADGLTVTPQVVVAVVVSFVVTAALPVAATAAEEASPDDRATQNASTRRIAWLFMVGSACFVLGSVPAYLDAVGGWVDGVTYVVGSLFFTTASYGQLVQAQSPGDDRRRRGHASTVPRPRAAAGLAAARPQLAGRGRPVPRHAVLQRQHRRRADPQRDRGRVGPVRLAAGPLRVDALPRVERVRRARGLGPVPHRPAAVRCPWRIAWLNMLGSVLFMASAIASYVAAEHRRAARRARVAVAGTFVGAVCFLVGAALMLPAWRRAVTSAAGRDHPDLTTRDRSPTRATLFVRRRSA